MTLFNFKQKQQKWNNENKTLTVMKSWLRWDLSVENHSKSKAVYSSSLTCNSIMNWVLWHIYCEEVVTRAMSLPFHLNTYSIKYRVLPLQQRALSLFIYQLIYCDQYFMVLLLLIQRRLAIISRAVQINFYFSCLAGNARRWLISWRVSFYSDLSRQCNLE